jgi:GT2 family glycosyltransferase/protoporphyrinogen oxidase
MRVGILGAGPAGLFAAWWLHQRGVDVTVFEAQPHVGGISRSFDWHGFTCDLGAHRLFTQDESMLRHLLSLTPMGRHIRRSQIYLAGKWMHDPVNVVEILYRYFPVTTMRIISGYLFRPRHTPEKSFDNFVHRQYGVALNQFFFRPYTEKLFGLPGDQISADWARRKVRISGPLDFLRESSKKHFSYFYYPIRGGFGAIPQRIYQDIQDHVKLNSPVCDLVFDKDRITTIVYKQENEYRRETVDHVISTLSLTVLGQFLGHSVELAYQSVDFVYLLIDRPMVSDNHWIYFMDDSSINRLIEFKNLSAVEQPLERTVLCAEVTSKQKDVAQKVSDDVVRCGLVRHEEILDRMVLHEEYGYAVYDLLYAERHARVKETLNHFGNLHLLGRSAEFQHLELDDIYANALALTTALVADESHILIGEESMPEPSAEPIVYAVILTFNHYDDTRECLESLQKTEYENLTILVVDNGSSDGTPDNVRADFPDVKVIETGRNLGVPWGYNVGFSHALGAGADYILMLNNDTVVAPEMLRHLVDEAQADPDAGILMPKILYYDDPDVVWSVGGRYRTFPPAHVILGQDDSSDVFEKPLYLEYALSCGLLIHRRAFEKAGLFDPGYFFFFDDWDFSERVRTHGLHITLAPEAKMWHKVSKSTGETGKEALFWKTWGESSTRFYRRHSRPVFISLFIHLGFLMARELVKGNGRMLKHFWAGVRDGLSKPLGPIPAADDVILPSVKDEA